MPITCPPRTSIVAGALTVLVLVAAACGSSDSSTSTDAATDPTVEAGAAAGEPLYAWVEYGADGPEARAIVDGGSPCPELSVDGASTAMATRAANDNTFPVVSCTATIGDSATEIDVGGLPLPVPTGVPERILVLGDTGCRMATGWFENCDGTGTGTPWSFLAAAEAAAAEQPDLIVHVGDYVYREVECDATQQPGCAGSPWGDNWPTWEADFFVPAAPLLDVAPWIVTRGNHEDCGRNHLGWLRFLDGRPLSADELTEDGCPQFSTPYKVPIREVDFLVLDTATDPTTSGLDPTAETQYTADFTEAAAMVTDDRMAWTVTHRPFWGVATDWRDATRLEATDATLQASIAAMPGGAWPDEVDMSLAGHIHLLETLSFTDGRPHQVVSGDAGTAQDSAITDEAIAGNQQVFDALGMTSDDFNSYHDFGYVLIEPASAGWTVTVKDIEGDVLEQFALR